MGFRGLGACIVCFGGGGGGPEFRVQGSGFRYQGLQGFIGFRL